MVLTGASYQERTKSDAKTYIYKVRLTKNTDFSNTGVPTPIAYWGLNESTGTRVDSIGNNHLFEVNSVTASAPGKAGGGAAYFVRANSEYLSIADNSNLSTGDIDFTVAAWVNLDSNANNLSLVGKWGTSADQREYLLQYSSSLNRFRFSVSSAGTSGTITVVNADTFGAPAVGTWYYLVAWHDATANTINISVNGTTDSTAHSTGVLNSTSSFQIGASNEGTAEFMSGHIDEVMFWKEVLSSAERTELYNGASGFSLTGDQLNFCSSRPQSKFPLGIEILGDCKLHRKAEPEYGRFPLSTLDFDLLDIDNKATTALAGGIIGSLCEFYIGYWDDLTQGESTTVIESGGGSSGSEWWGGYWDDYWGDYWGTEESSDPVVTTIVGTGTSLLIQKLFTGIVTEAENESGVYRVTARSRIAAAQDKIIFNGASSQLTAAISAVDTTLTLVDASGFDNASSSPQTAVRVCMVGDEVMAYRAKTATTLTSVLRPGANGYSVPPATGAFGGGSVAHSIGERVQELPKLGTLTGTNANHGNDELHPVELLKALFDNSGKDGISESGIEYNSTSLNAAKAALGANTEMRFLNSKSENAKRFIEEQIFLPCATYPLENADGELCMKLLQGSDDAEIVGTLTDTDIVSKPKWLRNAERIVNTVNYRFDYMPVTDEFVSSYTHSDSALISELGRQTTLEIEARGVRSHYVFTGGLLAWFSETDTFLAERAQAYIDRFGGVSPVITVTTTLKKHLLELGDDVLVSFSDVPNLPAASRTLENATMEIIGMRFDFRMGRIEFDLLGYPD